VPYDERDENDHFVPKYPEADFLTAVRESDDPTTGDVAREVGVERNVAYYRLGKLEEQGKVTSRKIGNANVWQLAE